MYACVCVRVETKEYIAAKYSSAHSLNVCICMNEAILASMQSLEYWSVANI